MAKTTLQAGRQVLLSLLLLTLLLLIIIIVIIIVTIIIVIFIIRVKKHLIEQHETVARTCESVNIYVYKIRIHTRRTAKMNEVNL